MDKVSEHFEFMLPCTQQGLWSDNKIPVDFITVSYLPGKQIGMPMQWWNGCSLGRSDTLK
jgi:hypothetical protein